MKPTEFYGSIEVPNEPPRKGAFMEMLNQEVRSFAWDASQWYWRQFSEWPLWRQLAELVLVRPYRRLRSRISTAYWNLRCRLGFHKDYAGECWWCSKTLDDTVES